jgi:hypothetical protein
MSAVLLQGPAAVTPGLQLADAHAAYWLSQVHLRLRREVSWCWHQRLGRTDPQDGSLPPLADACAENLDWVRFADQKQAFWITDPAGSYLSGCLQALTPPTEHSAWAALAEQLALSDAAQFVLALGLAQRLDAGLAPVFATCMNDLSRPFATLALAQRLWDEPTAIAACAGADQPLARHGLTRRAEPGGGVPDWQQPLEVPGLVATVLAGFADAASAGGMRTVPAERQAASAEIDMLAWRLAARPPQALEVVPLSGPTGADFAVCAAQLAAASQRPLLAAPDWLAANPDALAEYSTLAWLAGGDLLLPEGTLHGNRRLDAVLPACLAVPLRWFVPIQDRHELEPIPAAACLPQAEVPGLPYAERLALLLDGLGAAGERLRDTVEDCARRFRFQAPAARRVVAGLRQRSALDANALITACRIESENGLGQLAQRVQPRFTVDELVLPAAQAQQFEEVLRAMRSLTRVHYQWGTAKAWNEGGLSVLFCGPPGTGKTMAAEALGNALQLDLYRIDLSQVVNKYIGETEKNLKRIFDAAEASDCILFFDEADALFGKRTDVKDAHDRFANIEISYLLERMERFKGLAILATNRRKDLDEAFLRRLRYLIEFPVPGAPERERIWRAGFPDGVVVDDLDFRYLAKQFALSGGHIRSVIFNACLQAAYAPVDKPLPPGKRGRVGMPDVLTQLRRELQKMNRAAGDEQFGVYAARMGAAER